MSLSPSQISLRSVGLLAFFGAACSSVWASPSIKLPRFQPIEVISTAPTAYPELSVVAGGTLVLQLSLNESGRIERIDVINGIPSLTAQAERSVRQWKFKAARMDGKAEASVLIAAFSFSRPLPRGPTPKFTALPTRPGERFEPIQIISAAPALYPAQVVTFGTVILQITICSSGKIETIKTIHGIQWLTRQAKAAVSQWKFRSARLDGKPVSSSMIASFIFASSILNDTKR